METEFKKRASTEWKFLWKYLVIGLICLGYFVIYGAYDAFIGFPSQLPRAHAWEELVADESLNDTQRQSRWKTIAKEKGWNTNRPTEDQSVHSIEQKILFNYGCIALGLLLSVPNIGWYFYARNSWIEADGQWLRNSAGQELKISSITKIDKARWQKKGIAVLSYQTSEGDEKKFVIDDLKYERQVTDEIMHYVEQQVGPELIVNGISEAEYRKRKSNQNTPMAAAHLSQPKDATGDQGTDSKDESDSNQ